MNIKHFETEAYRSLLTIRVHSSFLDDWRYTDIPEIGGYTCGMVIPAIWDVIWGQTNRFPSLDRPPNPFSSKDRLSKKIISTLFEPLTEGAVIACKVLSKEVHPQVKKSENFFFANSISANSYLILMTTI